MRLKSMIYGYEQTARLDKSPATIRDYSLSFKRLVAFLGDKEFSDITAGDIRAFLLHLSDEFELSKKTLSNVWIALSALWSWAETEVGATHIIRGKVKRPKFKAPPVEPISREEFEKLLDACGHSKTYQIGERRPTCNKRPSQHRNRAILWTLIDSGLRAQELCDLTIADYDERRGRLHVRHGKGDKARFVPIGNTTKRALWRYLADRDAKPDAPLFSTRTGTHLDRNNLGNLLESLADTAGLKNIHPHRFRHTFAINFLRNGGNTLVLQALLGHESLEMVRKYARIAETDIDAAVKHSVADRWR